MTPDLHSSETTINYYFKTNMKVTEDIKNGKKSVIREKVNLPDNIILQDIQFYDRYGVLPR